MEEKFDFSSIHIFIAFCYFINKHCRCPLWNKNL